MSSFELRHSLTGVALQEPISLQGACSPLVFIEVKTVMRARMVVVVIIRARRPHRYRLNGGFYHTLLVFLF
jgi:hypothetical protein